MKLSAQQIKKLQRSGAKVKRTARPAKSAPKEKEVPVVVPPAQVSVTAPPMPKMPDYGQELKTLISTLDNRLEKPRRPWRIKVNRDRTGFAESYDVIPLEAD